jgi:hypothetical protein
VSTGFETGGCLSEILVNDPALFRKTVVLVYVVKDSEVCVLFFEKRVPNEGD